MYYGPEHVQWIKKQCDKHMPHLPFYCLSDIEIDNVNTIELTDNLPGWWSKIELFKHDDFIYIDLDTVILNDISYLMELDGFNALGSITKRIDKTLNSGLMRVKGGYKKIYENFSIGVTHKYKDNPKRLGDQGYIQDNIEDFNEIQKLYPRKFKSYSFDHLKSDNKPKCDVVIFHGKTKPWTVSHPWIPPL